MKKLITLMALVFAISNFMYAQTVGTPSTLFTDNSTSPLLSHVQSGNPNDLGNFNRQWIGIGQPSAGATVLDVYGVRTQWNNNAGLLALTGTGSSKKLELNWGGPSKTANFEINNITSFTNPNGKRNVFTIRPDGRVGIGTTAPGTRLDVRSTGTIAQFINTNSNGNDSRVKIRGARNACTTCDVSYLDLSNFDDNEGANGTDYILARISGGMETTSGKNSYLRFYTNKAGTIRERMRIKANGNVGIGVTNPGTRLDVRGTGTIAQFINTNSNGNDSRLKVRGARNACITCNVAYIDLSNFDDNEGANGSDFVMARISGGMETISGRNSYLRLFTTQSGTTTERMRIKANGNTGIGRTNPQYKLDINGQVRTTGGLVTSDKRYKENVEIIDNAMDKINELDGVTYAFKAGEINGYNFKAMTDERQIGFIAQNVQEVFPELVDADENDYLSVNYVALIPVLVEGIKEQQEVITEQEETILEQEEQLTDLQSRVERLEALLLNGNSSESQGNTPVESNRIDYSGIVLKQNAPNPFKDVTTINYELPSDLQDAQLVIYDLNGRIISRYNVLGTGSVDFNSAGLTNGTYAYAIVVNGQSVATSKMLIQK